jgi:hypothetical protein
MRLPESYPMKAYYVPRYNRYPFKLYPNEVRISSRWFSGILTC